ncbi:MAG: amidohydrolase, partial [Candidatus Obscuribacterales bacterium]|nr:amidohydrolase [Candidatus Obscuribacterales bacterium]
MKKVDIHTHILPPSLPDFKAKFGYGGFIKLEHLENGHANMLRDDGKFFRALEANCFDTSARLEDMEKRGVDLQVISTVPVMFNYWAQAEDCLETSRFLNEHIASVVEAAPRRFIGLATIPMQNTELAIKELKRSVNELGLAGIQIGTHINSKNLDESEFFPIFAAAEELSAAVFVHPWDMMAQERMT